MRYRNVKTGLELTSACVISGADFVEITPATAPKAEPKEKAEPKPKTTTKRSKK